MRVPRLRAARALSPAVEELVDELGDYAPRPLSARERVVEALAAATLVAAAGGMAVLLDWPRAFEPGPTIVLVLAYAIACRIKFRAGSAYTVPTQLVLVPMLFVLPQATVPLVVAVGILLKNLPEYLARRTHPDRAILSFGDAWHAVGPALVLSAFGADTPVWGDWPIYLLALTAQFAFDFGASAAREWFALGIAPGRQVEEIAWVYVVDALLAPVGFLAALAAVDEPYAVVATLPLAGLLAFFAQERSARIEAALELSGAYRGTALLLSDVLEADDEYTGLHSRGVVALALGVADGMGMDLRERRILEFAALLHDIGKIAIPKELINKPGPLTKEEWVVMATHTIEGQRMLDRVGGVLGEVGRVVRSSHERWDGGGYPDGLRGNEIPIASCIVSAADAFSAMTTDRPYRKAMSVEDAALELRRHAGTQFNPAVVEILISLVESDLRAAERSGSPAPAG